MTFVYVLRAKSWNQYRKVNVRHRFYIKMILQKRNDYSDVFKIYAVRYA